MKRIPMLLCALLAAFSLSAQETQSFQVYVFGSEYSGPTIAFLKDVEQNPELKERLSQLEYRYLNADEPDAAEAGYRYFPSQGLKEYPLFVLVHSSGKAHYQVGYSSAQKLLEDLNPEKLASYQLTEIKSGLSEKDIRKQSRRKAVPFGVRLFYSPWGLGAEGGVLFSNLAGSDFFTDYKTGYYASVFVNRYLSRNTRIQGGLTFHSLGGKHTGSAHNLRLNYLSLPIDFEKVILRPTLIPGLCAGNLNLGIGLYGSYLLADKPLGSGPVDVNDWDAGARLRLNYQSGSFRLNIGYMRGFVDLLPGPDKGYTNAFQLGFSMTFGD